MLAKKNNDLENRCGGHYFLAAISSTLTARAPAARISRFQGVELGLLGEGHPEGITKEKMGQLEGPNPLKPNK